MGRSGAEARDRRRTTFRHIERANAKGIAGEHQLPTLRIPETDGPLAVEAAEGLDAPLLIGVDDDLGIAARLELMPGGHEFGAKFEVVEDLAIERDPEGATFVGQWLLA